MVGAAYSFAFNGNFVICGGFSTLTNNSSLSSLALEPTDRTSFCVASPTPNCNNKKDCLKQSFLLLEMVGVEPTSIMDKN